MSFDCTIPSLWMYQKLTEQHTISQEQLMRSLANTRASVSADERERLRKMCVPSLRPMFSSSAHLFPW